MHSFTIIANSLPLVDLQLSSFHVGDAVHLEETRLLATAHHPISAVQHCLQYTCNNSIRSVSRRVLVPLPQFFGLQGYSPVVHCRVYRSRDFTKPTLHPSRPPRIPPTSPSETGSRHLDILERPRVPSVLFLPLLVDRVSSARYQTQCPDRSS